MKTVEYQVIEIWKNQHGISGRTYKKYVRSPTHVCPECGSGFKLRKKSSVGKQQPFLSKCEWTEARNNPDRACTGRMMRCPYCGEPLELNRLEENKHKIAIVKRAQ